jgi:hypothetical protein
VDCLFLWVDKLEKAMQEHHCRGDVLSSPSELWGVIPPINDVALDLASVTLGAAHWVMRMRHSLMHRAHQRRWWLVLPPLS